MNPEIDLSLLWLEELCCPGCGIGLRCEAGGLLCSACGKTRQVIEGVPIFVSSFPYWGEIPKALMPEVLRAADVSWRDALLGSQYQEVRAASEMILNLERANWSLLTDLPNNTRVLDLGAGMGANSHSLALRYREVVAIEPVEERVQFMTRRFQQEGIRNIRVIRTSLWELPFADATFDLIVMNGVLEWVASGREGNPRDVQQTALRMAARLLRPGGMLYVGIENRYVPGYFVGYPDPHTGMPWVTVLPRPLANAYAKQQGAREGYRNYLYSAQGYRKLLRESGFSRVDCYLALPSYNHPRFYMPLENNVFHYFVRTFAGTSSGWRNIARRVLQHNGWAKHLEYSFALLATK